MMADVINKLYAFFSRIMHQGERVLHMSEFELVLAVVVVLLILLILVVWWKRRVDRYNEAVWRAGRYTANDPYKERDMIKAVRSKDPWIVADPIGGSEVGEAMEVESLTDFMKKATLIQSPVESSNDTVVIPKSDSLPDQAVRSVSQELKLGARSAPHQALTTPQRDLPMQAGWYPDPSGMEGFFRYWDGGRWTGSISKRGGQQRSDSSDVAPPGKENSGHDHADTVSTSGNPFSSQELSLPRAENNQDGSNRDGGNQDIII